MPPGVSTNDIPGNRPEDEYEIWTVSGYVDLSNDGSIDSTGKAYVELEIMDDDGPRTVMLMFDRPVLAKLGIDVVHTYVHDAMEENE